MMAEHVVTPRQQRLDVVHPEVGTRLHKSQFQRKKTEKNAPPEKRGLAKIRVSK